MKSKRSPFFAVSRVAILAAASFTIAYAGDGTWSATAGGNWTDATKWSSSTIADGSGSTANFTTNITADAVVALNGTNRAIGNIIFSDSAAVGSAWTISGDTLTLAGGTPTITSTTDATISSVIDGTLGFTKVGARYLSLSGASPNIYSGDTKVTTGALILGKSSGVKAVTGKLVINGGANVWSMADNQLSSNTIVSNGNAATWACFTLLGTTQTLGGLDSPANNTMVANSTTSNSTPSPTGTGIGTLILNVTSPYTFAGDLWNSWRPGGPNGGGTVEGTLGLTKEGSGKQTLSGGEIRYTGATTVNNGTLELLSTGNYTSATTVNIGGSLTVTNTGNIGVNAAITLNNGAILTHNGTVNNAAYWTESQAVTVATGAAVTFNETSVANSGGINKNTFFDGGLKGGGAGSVFTINATNAGNSLHLRDNSGAGGTTYSGKIIVNGIANGTSNLGSGLAVNLTTPGLQNADIEVNGTLELGNTGLGWAAQAAPAALTMGALTGTGVVTTNGLARTIVVGNTNLGGTYSGIVQNGTSVLALTKIGSDTQILSGASSYTGATTVSNGTLALAGASGALGNTAITLGTGGTLKLDNTGAANSSARLNDSAAITLAGGTLQFASNAAAATNFSETTGAVTVSVPLAGTINTSQAAVGQTSTLTLGGLTGFANFSGTGLGVDARNKIVITGMANGTAVGFINGTALAAYDSALGVTAATYTDTAYGGTISDGATANIRLTGGASGNVLLNSGTTTVNTITQQQTGATVIDNDTKTLRLGVNGGIVLPSGMGSLSIGTTANSGILTAGGADNTAGLLSLINNDATSLLTINSAIINNGTGVVNVATSGIGTVILAGTNTYTGTTALGAATTEFSGGTQTLAGIISGPGSLIKSNAASTLTLSGANTYTGTVNVNAGTLTSAAFPAGTTSFLGGLGTASAHRVVNIASGAQVTYTNATANSFLSLGGVVASGGYGSYYDINISGKLAINDGAAVSQILHSTYNLSNGGEITNTGVANSGAYGLLFGWSLAGGGNINVTGTGNKITADRIGFSNGATITTNPGADLAITSIIGGSSQGATGLTKAGTGTLTLSGLSIYTGATAISGGTVVLNGASGAIANTAITIGTGGTLKLDNTGAANNGNRVGTGAITLAGGTLQFANDAAAATNYSETVGAVTTTLGGTITTSQAASGQTSTLTLGGLTGFTNFIGTGLGVDGRNKILITGVAQGTILGTINGTGQAVYDTTLGVIQATYIDVAFGGTINDGANTNIRLSGGTSGNVLLGSAITTVNLISQNQTSTTVIDNSSKTLRVGVGGILLPSGMGSLTIGTTPNSGILTAGAADNTAGTLNLTNNDATSLLTLNSPITDNGSGVVNVATFGIGKVVLAGTNTYTGTTVLGAAITEFSGGTQTLAGIISGSGSLLKSNAASTLTLTGANTYTGATTISAGILQLGSGIGADTATVNSTYEIGANGTLRLQYGTGGGVAQTWSKFTGAGTLALSSTKNADSGWGTAALGGTFSGTLQVERGRFITDPAAGGGLGGTTNVVVTNGGQLGMWQGGTFGQNFTIAGTGYGEANYESALRLGNAGTTTTLTGPVTLSADATLGGTGILSGGVSGAGGLTTGTSGQVGLIALNSASTYAGPTTINSGTLQFAKKVSLYNNQTASWTAANLRVASGTTAAFNVGGTGEFTASDIDTIKGLTNVASGVTATQGFKNGSLLGLDTSSAGANFTYATAITNHVAGATIDTLGLNKLGSGTLVLTGANSYTGNTAISAGTLEIGVGGTLGGGTYAGVISGAGSLVKSSTGNLILTGVNSYAGGTTISAGTLQIGNAGTTGTAGSGAIVDNGALVYNLGAATASLTSAGITGSGTVNVTALTVQLNGNVTTGGNQSYASTGFGNNQGMQVLGSTVTLTGTGGAAISLTGSLGHNNVGTGSTLNIDTSSGNGPINLNIAIGQSNVLYPVSVFNANAGTGTITVSGANGAIGWGAPTKSLTGVINISSTLSNTNSLTLNTTGPSTASSAISGTGSLIKEGADTLTLSVTNTYTGTTSVNAGTLLVNGSTHASSAVSVAALGTLGGTGTVNGAVTALGTLAPGTTGTGTLNTGAVTLTGTYACQLDGANSDKVAATGSLTVTGATLAISTLTPLTQSSYVIATYTTGATPAFTTVTGLPAGYTVDTSTTGQIKLVGTPAYANWASSKGLTAGSNGKTANPDGDTLNNLMEFAFGTNPLLSSGGAVNFTGGVLTPGSPTTSVTNNGNTVDFRAVFARRKDYVASKLVYTVQFSAGLEIWVDSTDSPADVVLGTAGNGAPDIDMVSVPYPMFIPTGGGNFKKPTFFRVGISEAP